ncbi:T9SS type A sorting domain-containing protein [Chryseobacterium koreense]
MKRILSFVFAATLAVSAYSQTLWTDNFESYTIGNLGTQGGWANEGGSASSVKIATIDGAHGKSMRMNTTATSDPQFIYKEINMGLANPDNEVFRAEVEMYTGNNWAEMQVYESDGTNYYAIFDIYLSPTNGAWLADQADFDADLSGELLTPNIAANTWYKVIVTYNISEGTMNVSINGTNYGPFAKEAYHYPTEIDLVASGTNNAGYDNIVIAADAALAVSNVNKTKVNVYPNPTTEVLNITADKKVANVTFFDMTGRKVKQTTENVINVEDLTKGSYIVSITFADGTVESKKVIKE